MAQFLPWHVLGAGSVGCLWAGRLTRVFGYQSKPQSVVLLVRDSVHHELNRSERVELMVSENCTKSSFQLKNNWDVSICIDSTKSKSPIHNLLLATKAYDASKAIREILPRLQQEVRVVILCNGMGVYEEIKDELLSANAHVFVGSSTHGTYTVNGGRFSIVHAGFGNISLGSLSTKSSSFSDLVNLAAELNASGLNVAAVRKEQIDALLWKKLAVNCSINPLTALLKVENGALLESQQGKQIVDCIVKEVYDRGIYNGVNFEMDLDELHSYVLGVIENTYENQSSMLQDVLRKKKTEIDYINGYIAKSALNDDSSGTPVNRALTLMIHMLESNYYVKSAHL